MSCRIRRSSIYLQYLSKHHSIMFIPRFSRYCPAPYVQVQQQKLGARILGAQRAKQEADARAAQERSAALQAAEEARQCAAENKR